MKIGGNGWIRIGAGVCAAVAACVAQGATVVHDAGRDLVLNESCANVYTNAYGGVWSFLRASSYTGARTLMPGARLRQLTVKDAQGNAVVCQRGPAKGDASPCFGVNPRSVADTSNLMAGSGWPAIPPGQLSCHPGNTSDAGNQCCVLRFTMPRTGTYTVTAKAWNQNVGWTAVSLFVNGEVRKTRQAWRSTASAVVTNDFSLVAATYRAGDQVELTVDGNGTYNSNATGLRFEVAEEVAEVIDAGASMRAHVLADGAAATAAWTDAAGAWRVESVPSTNAVKYLNRTLLDTRSVRATQGSNATGWSTSSSGTPWAHVNATDFYVVETNADGAATLPRGTALAPSELYLHPGKAAGKGEAGVHSVLVSLSPAASGRYDIGVTLRDVSWNSGADGVRVHLIQGGHELAVRRICCEQAAFPQNATIFLRDVPVAAGVPIELVVDQVGLHTADGTGLFWAMVRTSDAGVYSANAALIANLTSASPAATYTGDGATWQVGLWNNGTLTPFTTFQSARTIGPDKAMGNTAGTSPFMGANLKGRALTQAETSSNNKIAAGRDMIIGHPGGSGAKSTLRFTAPADGVYSVHAFAMDLDGGSSPGNAGDGVVMQVFTGGHQARVMGLKSITNQIDYAELDTPVLHLKAGEAADIVINPNAADANGHTCDLTGLYVWLSCDASTTDRAHVNIDFDAPDAQGAVATFAGAGRYGFSGEAWDSFRVGAVAEAKFAKATCIGGADDGKRTGLVLTLSRGGEPLVCDAGNTLTTDVGAAGALFVDGVVSASSDDPVTFILSGLLPGETYMLGFCSRRRTATGNANDATTVRGDFTVDGATDRSTHPWFALGFGDYANLEVTADANGVVTGTFASFSDEPAYWNGLQVEGPGFAKYVPTGTLIVVR